MRSRRARFLIVFFLLLAAFEFSLLLAPVDQHVIRPFTSGIAFVSGAALKLLGQAVAVQGTAITGNCFSVNINNGCNGVEVSAFLMAAIIAFPASIRSRAIAGAAGLALIQVVNFIRVLSLYFIGCYRREWFDAFHLAIWQTIVFAIAVLYFVQWTRTNTRSDAAQHA